MPHSHAESTEPQCSWPHARPRAMTTLLSEPLLARHLASAEKLAAHLNSMCSSFHLHRDAQFRSVCISIAVQVRVYSLRFKQLRPVPSMPVYLMVFSHAYSPPSHILTTFIL